MVARDHASWMLRRRRDSAVGLSVALLFGLMYPLFRLDWLGVKDSATAWFIRLAVMTLVICGVGCALRIRKHRQSKFDNPPIQR